jgi:hypothetical protein
MHANTAPPSAMPISEDYTGSVEAALEFCFSTNSIPTACAIAGENPATTIAVAKSKENLNTFEAALLCFSGFIWRPFILSNYLPLVYSLREFYNNKSPCQRIIQHMANHIANPMANP